jgi:hypothetical protein
MHDIILKGLSSLHGLSSEQELSNFLRGLRSTASGLTKVLIFDQDRVLDCNPILERMPRILTENLFVRKISGNEIAPDEDGLVCTRWGVPRHRLALQRI